VSSLGCTIIMFMCNSCLMCITILKTSLALSSINSATSNPSTMFVGDNNILFQKLPQFKTYLIALGV
jgi:hypothetical protein